MYMYVCTEHGYPKIVYNKQYYLDAKSKCMAKVCKGQS